MGKWNRMTIQECTDILGDGLHGTPKYNENGEYAFINGNNLINGKVCVKKETKRVDCEEYQKYKKPLNDRTILVSINGTLGNVGLYNDEKIVLGKSACFFNVKKSIDKDFIYYVVSSSKFKQYLEVNATGTTIKNFSLKQMREYSFEIPENIEEQKKVSSLLRQIDLKIQTNNEINDNLLNQVFLIYNQYLFDASPAKLGDLIFSIETGKRPKGGAENNGIPSIGAEKIERFGIYDYSSEKYINKEFYLSMKKGKVLSSDVLLYKDGAYTGKSSMALNGFPHDECVVNEHVFILRTINSKYQFFLYCCLNDSNIKTKIESLAAGKAAQPGLNQKELKSIDIQLPNINNLLEFENQVKPLMELIASNALENKKLVNLRDVLLPKLMSGELDISDIEI